MLSMVERSGWLYKLCAIARDVGTDRDSCARSVGFARGWEEVVGCDGVIEPLPRLLCIVGPLLFWSVHVSSRVFLEN